MPSTFDFQNLGEIAMLQVAVRRVHEIFDGASVEVLTSDPRTLPRFCPGSTPVPYDGWLADHYLLGRAHRILPDFISSEFIVLRRWVRRVMPELERAAIRLHRRLRKGDGVAFETCWSALQGADVLVVSGLGGIGDVFPANSALYLDMIDWGLRRGIPVAVLGHGFGPLNNRKLRARARRTLPRVSLIGLREGLHSSKILASIGVSPEKITVTGDDAIELAYEARSPDIGSGLGVNVRPGARSRLTAEDVDRIRPIVQAEARRRGVGVIPVPIARHGELDAAAIRRLLVGFDDDSDGGSGIDSATQLIARMRGCRIVLTGAYHAAVFALAQGIPTVCLVYSEYFASKFTGLADLFGSEGCKIVVVSSPDFQERLRSVLEETYDAAERMRPDLLKKAEWQIRNGHAAYRRFQQMVLHPEAAPRAAGAMASEV